MGGEEILIVEGSLILAVEERASLMGLTIKFRALDL